MNKMTRRLLSVIGLTAIVVTACAPSGTTQAPSPSDAPVRGSIVIGLSSDPDNLDYLRIGIIDAVSVTQSIFDSLVHRDASLNIVPRLATSWTNTDSKTWRFNLRHGVKFHNGEDFNADVVKFSIERALSNVSFQRANLRNINGVSVVDPYTVDIVLNAPDAILPELFADNYFMYPPRYTTEKGDAYVANNAVGTGPYIFKEWVKGDHITLEANPDYWGGKPRIKTVLFRTIPEASTRVAALQSGEVDIAMNVPVARIQEIQDRGVAEVKSAPSFRVVYLGLRAGGPIRAPQLQDRRVRQALNYAVNKQGIVDALLLGRATILGQPAPPIYVGYDPSIAPYPYDLEKAKALLAEAGYAQGFEIQMNIASNWVSREQGQAIQADLARVGVKVDLRDVDVNQHVQTLLAKNITPMYSLAINSVGNLDAVDLLRRAFVPGGSGNFNEYSNPQIEDLVNKASAQGDRKAREAFLFEAGRLLHDDAPWIFLWNDHVIFGVKKGITWSPRPDKMVFVYDDVR